MSKTASTTNPGIHRIMTPNIHVDLNEGRTIEVGCLACRADVTATLEIAQPFRFYVAGLRCLVCEADLVTFDVMNGRVA